MSNLEKELRVRDHTLFPGPRFKKLGAFSGEWFREDILQPRVQAFGSELIIDLDGVFGYGSSFLDESFAGLLRAGVDKEIVLNLVDKIKSLDDPELVIEIKSYVTDQIQIDEQHSKNQK